LVHNNFIQVEDQKRKWYQAIVESKHGERPLQASHERISITVEQIADQVPGNIKCPKTNTYELKAKIAYYADVFRIKKQDRNTIVVSNLPKNDK
jgi:hypothetical protein